MTQWFGEERNCELSTLDYLTESFASDWTAITVLKNFKNAYSADNSLPIVCVGLLDTESRRKEVGGTAWLDNNMIVIDIFATSDGQRLDIASYVKSKIKDCWTYYTYANASGDTKTLDRVEAGKCTVTQLLNNTKVEIEGSVDVKDRFRQNITIMVKVGTT